MDTQRLRALHEAAGASRWRVILPGDTTWRDRTKYRCVLFDAKTDEDTMPISPDRARLIVASAKALPLLLDIVDAALRLDRVATWSALNRPEADDLRDALRRLEEA